MTHVEALTLWDPPEPRFRNTDPNTSALAAESVKPGNGELVNAIRWLMRTLGDLTHEEIADRLAGYRWTRGTVITACARAGLVPVGATANSRGQTVTIWRLAEDGS